MRTFPLFWLQLATKPGSPESLQQLVEILRNPGANATILGGVSAGKEDRGTQSKDKKVPVKIVTCELSLLCKCLCSTMYFFVCVGSWSYHLRQRGVQQY